MGKKSDNKQKQPAFVEKLLKNGTAILTAKTRDELAEMINDIPADVRYCSGAVGYNHETGVFSLRVDLTND
jgi:hypothetical protein